VLPWLMLLLLPTFDHGFDFDACFGPGRLLSGRSAALSSWSAFSNSAMDRISSSSPDSSSHYEINSSLRR
jgi:hypothetical protein